MTGRQIACAIKEKRKIYRTFYHGEKTDSMYYHGKKTDSKCYHGKILL